MSQTAAPAPLQTRNNVTLLYADGFGFGTGSISVRQQIASGDLTHGALIIGTKIIENDPRVFRAVDGQVFGDGCGDGRPTADIYRFENGKKKQFHRSLLRAKIFGGGLVVFASMLRSAVWGTNALAGDTILADRTKAAEILAQYQIIAGAHTGPAAHPHDSGCGAIDAYPTITANALQFRDAIEGVLAIVFGADYPSYSTAVATVFAHYQALSDASETYFANASGAETLALLESSGAVIKQLADKHLEDFIVINGVQGETFDQRAFDASLHEYGVKGTAQAFVVDTWRGQAYAELTADVAEKAGKNKDEVYKIAMIDFLVRTLATAGTLTAGDLPVFYRA